MRKKSDAEHNAVVNVIFMLKKELAGNPIGFIYWLTKSLGAPGCRVLIGCRVRKTMGPAETMIQRAI